MAYTLTFKQMSDQTGRFIQDTSSARATRIQEAINRRYSEEADGYSWSELEDLRNNEINFFSNEEFVYLPNYIDVVQKIVEDSSNEVLEALDRETFLTRNNDQLTTVGNPRMYTIVGQSAIKRKFASTPETITIESSDTGDTSLIIEVWGLVGGEEINETITTNASDGTTAVTSTNTFSRIFSISTVTSIVDSSRAGSLTVKGSTSTTTYAVITPHARESSYQKIRLAPVPNANGTMSIAYKKKVHELINDGDTPEIPIGPALVELAIADILRQQHKWSPAQFHEGRGNQMISDYQSRYLIQTETIQQSVPFQQDRLSDNGGFVVTGSQP